MRTLDKLVSHYDVIPRVISNCAYTVDRHACTHSHTQIFLMQLDYTNQCISSHTTSQNVQRVVYSTFIVPNVCFIVPKCICCYHNQPNVKMEIVQIWWQLSVVSLLTFAYVSSTTSMTALLSWSGLLHRSLRNNFQLTHIAYLSPVT